ncbi:MAG: hypothetical protein ABFR89_02375 [Actinomycetota bacterium]
MSREEKTWVNVQMPASMRDRIGKAAARNGVDRSKYLRELIEAAMKGRGDWTIPGPRKGSA